MMGSHGLGRAFKFLSVALVLGAIAVLPGRSAMLENAGETGGLDGPIDIPTNGAPEDPRDPSGNEGPGDGPVTDPEGPQQEDGGLECNRAGNGGATDVGVTADRIRLASTVVKTGPGSSFLGESPFAMQAVVSKVNAAGGICGRLLELQLADDGWEAQRGLRFIRNFISEGYFALPVVPSSEGLTAAIEAGDIDKAGIPVVGSDGMLRQQYDSQWVWPVATATVSTMRIMAKFGYDKGARCFGIVYDKFYRFGKEGAEAFRQYINTLSGGAKMCADIGILPAQASYSSEIQRFNSSCNGKCDFVAMLLEPQTALTWIAGRPQFGSLYTSGAQTLFNEGFAASCGSDCNGMLVWTGYNPPIGALASLPDVAQYRNDVKRSSPTADTTNQFLEGAYLGMTVFVEALKEVGPNLTRKRLQQVLNSTTFQTDIATRLGWSGGDRHANKAAQAFSVVVAQGSFAGFRNEQTGFIEDPAL